MIVKPIFGAGSEEKFNIFYQNLKTAKKIVSVSHTDVDGISSAKIVSLAVDVKVNFFIDYIEINESLIERLKKEKPSHVIFTDLLFRDGKIINEISKFAKVLIIDHHVFESKLEFDNVTFLNAQGFCATYLAYYLFSLHKDLTKYDWLVAYASLADILYFKNEEWMKEVYKKYGEKFEIDKAKTGLFWNNSITLSNALIYFDKPEKVYSMIKEDLNFLELKPYSKEVEDEVNNCLRRFEDEKEEIKEGYFWEHSSKFPIKSVISTIISFKYSNKTILIGTHEGERYLLSARRQDKKESMRILLQRLIKDLENSDAGGHDAAAGGFISSKDVEIFKKRLKNL